LVNKTRKEKEKEKRKIDNCPKKQLVVRRTHNDEIEREEEE